MSSFQKTKEAIERHKLECEAIRSQLPEGPWMAEPDRQEFKAYGFNCLVARAYGTFALCGYVGIPKSHPLYGATFNELDEIDVHGGLTHSEKCVEHICHLSENEEDLWWLGFDCAHTFDLCPGVMAFLKDSQSIPEDLRKEQMEFNTQKHYWTFFEVKKETERLARQLDELRHIPA